MGSVPSKTPKKSGADAGFSQQKPPQFTHFCPGNLSGGPTYLPHMTQGLLRDYEAHPACPLLH